MEAHLLRTFLAVCDTGSFSAAATRLGYTQSAVSQHIAALETDLGVTLLSRRPVAPTEAGRRLREHASLILLRLAAARADVVRSVAPPARLVLGLTPLAWTSALPTALAEVGPAQIEVRVLGRTEVVAGVATGELDLGLLDGYAAPSDPLRLPEGGLTVAPVAIAEYPVVVAMPADHPLAHRPALALADLADAYWIDAPGVVGLAEVRAAAGLDGMRAGLRYEGTDTAVLLGLVAAGYGLTLLPSRLDCAGVPVSTPRLVHRVELLRGTGTSEAAGRLAARLG